MSLATRKRSVGGPVSPRRDDGTDGERRETLPKGWRSVRVSDVGEVQLGRQRSPKHHTGLHMRPYLRVANVHEDRIDLSDVKTMNFTPNEFTTFELRPNDILLNEGQSLELVGRPALYRGELPGVCFQNTLVRFRPGPLVEPRFALFVFRAYLCTGRFQKIARWTTNIAHLGAGRFAEMSFPLPPLAEQRAIVAEIEKQFTRLDAGVAALKRVQANFKRYRAAVLKAACEGKLVPTEGTWRFEPLSVLTSSLNQGWSPKCEAEPSKDVDEWAVITTTAIQPLRFWEHENKRLPPTLDPRPALELKAGDLLMTRAGPRSRAGITCLVRTTRPRLILCDKAYRIRVRREMASASFLEIVLNAPPMLDRINELKTGISDSGVNLTQKRFSELTVPLPPLSEQNRIVTEVERRLSLVDELEQVVTAGLGRAKRLRQAILRRAFEGRVTR